MTEKTKTMRYNAVYVLKLNTYMQKCVKKIIEFCVKYRLLYYFIKQLIILIEC